MSRFFRSYLRYARGEAGFFSPWALLRPFGSLFGIAAGLRGGMYDRGVLSSSEPPIPVISVGNICHGGTNKTPTVEYLVRALADLGAKPGVITRGYGGKSRDPIRVVTDGSVDRHIFGDEPTMLAERLGEPPVVVSPDRFEGVCLLADLGVNVAVADDAFQHRRMGRDVDIALIDAACPFGNGKLFPAGIMREKESALARAHIIVLTKADQVSPEALAALRERVRRWAPDDRIFTAHMEIDSWLAIKDMKRDILSPSDERPRDKGGLLAFCAIGNPDSFERSLCATGAKVVRTIAFRDHHRYTWKDIDQLERAASISGASAFACTEKDLQNMPQDSRLVLPLYVPRVRAVIDDEQRFWRKMTELLRPKIVVASNGYGEDAIGALAAEKLKARFPSASVRAFSLVGSGKEYSTRGVEVISPPSEMPSAGVVKYSLRALIKDLRHGLGRDIKTQVAALRKLRGSLRTILCVGDVYLMMIALWGYGLSPMLLATAKSVLTNGHMWIESSLMRRRARMVWTRDAETAEDLRVSGVAALFRGSPIMDLAADSIVGIDAWGDAPHPRVLMLPGSRPRAYDDVAMLVDAASLMAADRKCSFLMGLAPTTDADKMFERWDRDGSIVRAKDAEIAIFTGPAAAASAGADILVGLGGTANQVAAGSGVPVVSILEKGKLAQKKLLRGSEELVPATAQDLARAALALLDDEDRMREMGAEGRRVMGGPGAIDAVVEHAASELGWSIRCELFERVAAKWSPDAIVCDNAKNTAVVDGEASDGGDGSWSASNKEEEETPEERRDRMLRIAKAARAASRTLRSG